ncbi:MAG: hypothetical protein ACI87E_005183, partial [Mariniblastus sp.]
ETIRFQVGKVPHPKLSSTKIQTISVHANRNTFPMTSAFKPFNNRTFVGSLTVYSKPD